MKTTLVIMAAGIGSRYGAGVKQLAAVGPNGELIIDYSIHDAIEAGFNKIIFIIRRDIEADFREVIGDRIETVCGRLGVEVAYTFQSLEDLPEGIRLPSDRIKPWGTGQAVLTCKGLIREPFAVINADDYYGKESFVRVHDYLLRYTLERGSRFCMAGFILKNTLSENGAVTRGICKMRGDGHLSDIRETKGIVKTEDGAAVDGRPVDINALVSMNMWGLTPEFIGMLEEGFAEFFEEIEKEGSDICMAEYLLPIYIGKLLREEKVSVQVLETDDHWFGVTYREDRAVVEENFRLLIEQGIYRADDLFADCSPVQE